MFNVEIDKQDKYENNKYFYIKLKKNYGLKAACVLAMDSFYKNFGGMPYPKLERILGKGYFRDPYRILSFNEVEDCEKFIKEYLLKLLILNDNKSLNIKNMIK